MTKINYKKLGVGLALFTSLMGASQTRADELRLEDRLINHDNGKLQSVMIDNKSYDCLSKVDENNIKYGDVVRKRHCTNAQLDLTSYLINNTLNNEHKNGIRDYFKSTTNDILGYKSLDKDVLNAGSSIDSNYSSRPKLDTSTLGQGYGK